MKRKNRFVKFIQRLQNYPSIFLLLSNNREVNPLMLKTRTIFIIIIHCGSLKEALAFSKISFLILG